MAVACARRTNIMPAYSLLLLACLLQIAPSRSIDAASVTFQAKPGAVYDSAPKLKLKGSGFDQLAVEVDLLELTFDPPLTKGETYKASVKADDTIALELISGKRWAEFGQSQRPPVPLELTGASFKETTLLQESIRVADLIPTPVVYPSTNIVYITATPHLALNGTNFNTKNTMLFFSPALALGEDINIVVKSSDTIYVKLIPKADYTARWADEPGPLKLVAIDTGAGRLKLREDLYGVTIGEIQADMQGFGIKVFSNVDTAMYQSYSKTLTIAGSGFEPGHTLFRFFNAIKEEANYTSVVTEESATLTLIEGNKWKMNAATLPGPLVLLAAKAGAAWVPVGATSGKSGRKVATIYEDPVIHERSTEISRTLTHELAISGSGFTDTFPPMFAFEPAIDANNYVVHVLNRTVVKVSLASFAVGWLPEGEPASSNLYVTHVNTGAGMLQLDQAVRVAIVKADAEVHDSGIQISPNYDVRLYQSSDTPLMITGKGFREGQEPKLSFGTELGPDEGGVTCERISETELKLQLVDGHKWAETGGHLFVTKIAFGDIEVPFEGSGVKVATVLDDPTVIASQLHVYASHTKRITIQGKGLVSQFDKHYIPGLVLSPTPAENFEVRMGGWTPNSLTLNLARTEGSSNDYPKWAEVGEDETVALKVMSIDTGAGPVDMPGGGIVVASVQLDDGSYMCEDSCLYANDQQCDEEQVGAEAFGWSRASSTNYVGSSWDTKSQQDRGYAGAPDESFTAGFDDMLQRSPSCEIGTDCTDCGVAPVDEGTCLNTCEFARDDSCDDPRGTGLCPEGTDCQDCGASGDEGNFTRPDTSPFSSSIFEDDDDNFLADDSQDAILEGQRNNAQGRYKRVFKKHKIMRQESESGEKVFIDVLWCAIVLVGVVATGFIMMFVFRCVKGERVHLPIPTNPDVEGRR